MGNRVIFDKLDLGWNLTHIDSKRPKTLDNKMLPFALAGGIFLYSIL